MNNFFDHIFCLNLARRPDRAAWTQEHCSRLNLLYEFFPGVDGSVLQDVHARLRFPGRPGNLGATLSHLGIYQTALARGYQKILIIEDDLVYHKDLPNQFSKLKLQIPSDWEMIYFAWIPVDEEKDEWNYNLIRNRFVSPNILRANQLWSAMAYGIKAPLMKDILDAYRSSFEMEIDRFFVHRVQTQRSVYATWPQLFAGRDDHSDCGGKVVPVFQRSHDTRVTRDEDFF